MTERDEPRGRRPDEPDPVGMDTNASCPEHGESAVEIDFSTGDARCLVCGRDLA